LPVFDQIVVPGGSNGKNKITGSPHCRPENYGNTITVKRIGKKVMEKYGK
jgi:hypothetical protein